MVKVFMLSNFDDKWQLLAKLKNILYIGFIYMLTRDFQYSTEFCQLFDTFNLTQHTNGPTHEEYTLDPVITRSVDISLKFNNWFSFYYLQSCCCWIPAIPQ